jgi:hypothetical protein
MTTIAFDGRYFASDTQVSLGSMRDLTKIRKLIVDYTPERETLFAVTGELAILPVLIRWTIVEHCAPELYPPMDSNIDFTFIAYHKSERIVRAYSPTSKGYPIFETAPFAVGSGAAFAFGALSAGQSAEKAVEVAGALDLFSNKHVEVFDTKTFKFVKTVRAAKYRQPLPWIKHEPTSR